MASRFDRRDPAEDPDYCNGLSPHRAKPTKAHCDTCGVTGDAKWAALHHEQTGHPIRWKGKIAIYGVAMPLRASEA